MGGAGIIALVLVSALAFAGQGSAYPSDLSETTASLTSSAPITATTSPSVMKEVKEPKDIKDSATASKSLKDTIKAGKEARKNKKDCMKDGCTEYDPICVHDPADPKFKPRTFGSLYVLELHNCEMGTKLAMKSKGECPGSGGVKLS